MTDNPQITTTWVGREYGWDWLSDVKWDILFQNLESLDNIRLNPTKFPKADFARVEQSVFEIETFLQLYGSHRQ